MLSGKLLVISLFIMLIHLIETLAYATRLSGARIKMIASAIALFSVMVIVARTSNMIQQPFTATLIDTANRLVGQIDQAMIEATVETQFRILIGAATFGTIIGALLMPSFIAIFSRAVIYLKDAGGSVPTLFKQRFRPSYLKRAFKHLKLPSLLILKELNYRSMSVKFFLTNMLITAIYTIGVLSALYASILEPDRAATAIMASGLVNGIATILLVVFIDPKISYLADEVSKDSGHYMKLRDTTGLLVISRIFGTLFAQIIFIPGAKYIAWVTKFLV